MTTITLDAADTATVAAGGSITLGITGTAAVAPPVPPVPPIPPTPPTPPVSGSNVCYSNGFNWPGDWSGSGVQLNYSDALDGLTVLGILTKAAYPYWLPFCPLDGPPATGGGLTPSLDLSPYTEMILTVKPTTTSDVLQLAFDTYTLNANGETTGDVNIPLVKGGANPLVLTPYASAPDANGFVTYTIPLSLWVGAPALKLYKFLLQNQTAKVGSTWYVSEAYFK